MRAANAVRAVTWFSWGLWAGLCMAIALMCIGSAFDSAISDREKTPSLSSIHINAPPPTTRDYFAPPG